VSCWFWNLTRTSVLFAGAALHRGCADGLLWKSFEITREIHLATLGVVFVRCCQFSTGKLKQSNKQNTNYMAIQWRAT
jgi:hypothetical protein